MEERKKMSESLRFIISSANGIFFTISIFLISPNIRELFILYVENYRIPMIIIPFILYIICYSIYFYNPKRGKTKWMKN